MSETGKTALYLCGAHRGGKTVKQLQYLISEGVTKIIVEESNLKQQRDDLLEACEKADWLLGVMIEKDMLNADSDVKKLLEVAIAKCK